MGNRIARVFLLSVAAVLAVTVAAKLYSATGTARILSLVDRILHLNSRLLRASDFAAYPLYAGPTRLWMESLEPYLGTKWPDNVVYHGGYVYSGPPKSSVYTCPGYDSVHGFYQMPAELGQVPEIVGEGAYSYNGGEEGAATMGWMLTGAHTLLLTGGLGGGTNGPTRESGVLAPSQMIAVGDSAIVVVMGVPNNFVFGSVSAPQFGFWFAVPPPGYGFHSGAHVGSYPPDEVDDAPPRRPVEHGLLRWSRRGRPAPEVPQRVFRRGRGAAEPGPSRALEITA